jgi:hypothetical protein
VLKEAIKEEIMMREFGIRLDDELIDMDKNHEVIDLALKKLIEPDKVDIDLEIKDF